MTKTIYLTSLFLLTAIICSYGQNKMLVGKKHTIFVDIPKNWVQAQNIHLPFFIKPDEKNVNERTYSYVYGLDYEGNPDLNGWIEGTTKHLIENNKGLKVDSLNLQFENLKKDDYLTGRYKTIVYEYEDKRKEVLLLVECKNTIVTCVLSAVNDQEYQKHIRVITDLGKSLRVLGTKIKLE